jgi:hypothetical protein
MNPRNAYWMLELSPDATPAEIEREGRKLLGLLELGTARGKTYACPLGTFSRDATMVRDAMAALRDPKRRARERCVASLIGGPPAKGTGNESANEDVDAPVPDALRIVYPGL